MDQVRHSLQVQVTRGGYLESHHAVEVIVLRGDSQSSLSFGGVDRNLFPRSTLKWVQALPLVELLKKGLISSAELTLACASHRGEEIHLQHLRAWKERLKLQEELLVCGFHLPGSETAAEHFLSSSTPDGRTKLFNNCAGKHLGFCHWSLLNKLSPEGYWKDEHPVQEKLRSNLLQLLNEPIQFTFGVDGCGVPNYRMTLRQLATVYLNWLKKSESEITLKAISENPVLLSGSDGTDTMILRDFPGAFAKTGAEGMYIAVIPEIETAVALKAVDGNTRASRAAILAILSKLQGKTEKEIPLFNWAGEKTGQILVEGVGVI